MSPISSSALRADVIGLSDLVGAVGTGAAWAATGVTASTAAANSRRRVTRIGQAPGDEGVLGEPRLGLTPHSIRRRTRTHGFVASGRLSPRENLNTKKSSSLLGGLTPPLAKSDCALTTAL